VAQYLQTSVQTHKNLQVIHYLCSQPPTQDSRKGAELQVYRYWGNFSIERNFAKRKMQNTALAIEQGSWCHRIHVPRLGWDVGLILGVLFCIPYGRRVMGSTCRY